MEPNKKIDKNLVKRLKEGYSDPVLKPINDAERKIYKMFEKIHVEMNYPKYAGENENSCWSTG